MKMEQGWDSKIGDEVKPKDGSEDEGKGPKTSSSSPLFSPLHLSSSTSL